MRPFILAAALALGCTPTGAHDPAPVQAPPCGVDTVPHDVCVGARPYSINDGQTVGAVVHRDVFVTCAGREPSALSCIATDGIACHVSAGEGPKPEGLPMCAVDAEQNPDGVGTAPPTNPFGNSRRAILPRLVAAPRSDCDRDSGSATDAANGSRFQAADGVRMVCGDDGSVTRIEDSARGCSWMGGFMPPCPADALRPVFDVR